MMNKRGSGGKWLRESASGVSGCNRALFICVCIIGRPSALATSAKVRLSAKRTGS